MNKTATINTRIEPDIKIQAEGILHNLGLNNTEAIRLFYQQICLHQGLPFAVKVPNKLTQKAMNDATSRKTSKAKTIKDLFADLDA
jgi:DNA-damage-inducible protein J